MTLLDGAADAVRDALAAQRDWGEAGTRPGQHHSDLTADAAAVAALQVSGVAVLSEESGITGSGAVTVIVDPLDGSTNAAQGLPWYAVSLCAVQGGVAVAALVENLATGERFAAERGAGATRNAVPIRVAAPVGLAGAIVGLSGLPPRHLGWRQFRALGALALDLCAVAGGRLDGYLDASLDAHGVWDYAGGLLVLTEAGGVIGEARGRDLLVLDPAARRTPVAASNPGLLAELLEARGTWA
jgi:myo-inositol-1(or 4)-monophosphatase